MGILPGAELQRIPGSGAFMSPWCTNTPTYVPNSPSLEITNTELKYVDAYSYWTKQPNGTFVQFGPPGLLLGHTAANPPVKAACQTTPTAVD